MLSAGREYSNVIYPYDADTTFASDSDKYDLTTHMNSGSSWDSYFWLGGPGAG